MQYPAQHRPDNRAKSPYAHRPAKAGGAYVRRVVLHRAGIGQNLRADGRSARHGNQQVQHRHWRLERKQAEG
ncbi:hypothetical protein D3C79_905950 [compost metagenome]